MVQGRKSGRSWKLLLASEGGYDVDLLGYGLYSNGTVV